jgi:signal transduction histidine kinase
LTVKEALNNVLRHSGAKRVVFSIADNGCGMADAKEPDKAKRIGRDLTNLRERLTSIHGQFELQSEPGRGTEVRFVVPLAGTHTFM